MLVEYDLDEISPALSRKLLIANYIFSFDQHEIIHQKAVENLLEIPYENENELNFLQFLDDSNYRTITLYNNHEFIDAIVKITKHGNVLNSLFVTNDLHLHKRLTKNLKKEEINFYTNLDEYNENSICILDVKSFEKNKNKILYERMFEIMWLDGDELYKSQKLSLLDYNFVSKTNFFLKKSETANEVRELADRLFGENSIHQYLYKKVLFNKLRNENGLSIDLENFNKIIMYLAGISTHYL